MITKMRATIDDLYKIKEKAEIVCGEIKYFMATGGRPAYAGSAVYRSLFAYVEQSERSEIGEALDDNVGFHVDLPNRESFSPDAAYYVGPDPDMKFFEGAPVFAAEVRSEHDYGPAADREIADKRADYFAAGTQVVWDVDLLNPDVVKKYTSDNPNTPVIFRRGAIADAEPAVRGWTMPVDNLFKPVKKGAETQK